MSNDEHKLMRERFVLLNSIRDLSELLRESNTYKFISADNEVYYRSFYINKKSGDRRRIDTPVYPLKHIQKTLSLILEAVYEPRFPVQGYRKGKSVFSNAEAHCKNGTVKYVINVDLRNFFPSIHFVRIRGMFCATPYNMPDNIAIALANLCCLNGKLPQGAPTSPIISNMVCKQLDSHLVKFAKKNNLFYTRYVDDMTFSTREKSVPMALAKIIGTKAVIGHELKHIIESDGFAVNESKVRILHRGMRQEVTGLTINTGKPNVSQKFVKEVRAILHDWEKRGYTQAQQAFHKKYYTNGKYKENRPELRDVLRGKINYIGMVKGREDKIYQKYMKKLSERDGFIFEDKMHKASYPASIFLSYASEDEKEVRGIYSQLKQAGYKPWMFTEDLLPGQDNKLTIEKQIRISDFFMFFVSKNSLKEGFLQRELTWARDVAEEKFRDSIFSIPIRLDDSRFEEGYKNIYHLNWYEDRNRGWQKMVEVLDACIPKILKQSN